MERVSISRVSVCVCVCVCVPFIFRYGLGRGWRGGGGVTAHASGCGCTAIAVIGGGQRLARCDWPVGHLFPCFDVEIDGRFDRLSLSINRLRCNARPIAVWRALHHLFFFFLFFFFFWFLFFFLFFFWSLLLAFLFFLSLTAGSIDRWLFNRGLCFKIGDKKIKSINNLKKNYNFFLKNKNPKKDFDL